MLRIYNADSERPVRLVTGSMSFLEMLWDSDVPLPANTYADALERDALIGIKLAQIEASDNYYAPEGWYEDVYAETGFDYTYHRLPYVRPLYWMPLPKPPEKEGE